MPPIIFIHGFPLDSTLWQAQSTFLQSHNLQIHSPNLPGFGDNSTIPSHPSIDDYAESIHSLIHQNGGGKFIIAGLSMGGYVLLSLLRNYFNHIAAAILIDTRAEADSPEARANRLKTIANIQSTGNTNSLIDAMLPRLLAKNAPPKVQQQTRDMMARQSPKTVIAAQIAMSNRPDQTDLLPQIYVPTLIVVGQEDQITPPAVAQSMHRAIPKSRLVEIPNVGHMTPLESPDALNAAILEFVRTV